MIVLLCFTKAINPADTTQNNINRILVASVVMLILPVCFIFRCIRQKRTMELTRLRQEASLAWVQVLAELASTYACVAGSKMLDVLANLLVARARRR